MTPEWPVPPFPELERLERTALAYAWSMLFLGIGIGFVLAWIMCTVRSCEAPRERVVPRPAAATSHGVRSLPPSCDRVAAALVLCADR